MRETHPRLRPCHHQRYLDWPVFRRYGEGTGRGHDTNSRAAEEMRGLCWFDLKDSESQKWLNSKFHIHFEREICRSNWMQPLSVRRTGMHLVPHIDYPKPDLNCKGSSNQVFL